ncbi:MAG: M28 family metallopeptidase [Pseudomonadota bacterium]
MSQIPLRRLLGGLVGVITFAACQPAVQDAATTPLTTDELIRESDLGRRIETLASDAFMGRAPGTEGGRLSAQYIADEMKAAGLVPMGDNGTYFQNVTLTKSLVSDVSTYAISNDGSVLVEGVAGENVTFWSKRLDPTITLNDSEMVFVGYGVVAPEYDWNDYEGLDITGKTVVMLVNDPGFGTQDPELFNGNSMTYYGRWTYKFEEAGRQGAAGAIVIHQTAPASYPWEVVGGAWTGPQNDLVRPDGGANRTLIESWVNEETAVAMFEAAGLDFTEMASRALSNEFEPVPLDGLTLDVALSQQVLSVESPNVAGGIIGTESPDEFMLYMAHWDHMGQSEGEGDTIYNGAVDNATGTSAIIEIGEAFVEKGAPKRSAIFVAVTAEESGLLGSAYYAAKPLVPLAQTVAGINIDGVQPLGKTKDMIVVGYGASELEDRLNTILMTRDMRIQPDVNPSAGYFYRSDHISLAKEGVPMLYPGGGIDHVTKGSAYGEAVNKEYTAERYHKPGDEYDNSWDLSGIKQIAEILFELGYDLADSDDWPNWYDGNEFRALRDEMRSETIDSGAE